MTEPAILPAEPQYDGHDARRRYYSRRCWAHPTLATIMLRCDVGDIQVGLDLAVDQARHLAGQLLAAAREIEQRDSTVRSAIEANTAPQTAPCPLCTRLDPHAHPATEWRRWEAEQR